MNKISAEAMAAKIIHNVQCPFESKKRSKFCAVQIPSVNAMRYVADEVSGRRTNIEQDQAREGNQMKPRTETVTTGLKLKRVRAPNYSAFTWRKRGQ